MFGHNFLKSVGLLVGSAALAQVFLVLALPLLTRLYTPEDFSVLAVYAAILGIVSVVSCLRFDVAVALPQSEDKAANLLVLALCISFGVSALSALFVVLFPAEIVTLVAQPKLKSYLWILPLGIWTASSCSAMLSWATRKRRFLLITTTRLTQSISVLGVQVCLGCAGIAPLGLLLGQMLGNSGGIFGLVSDALRQDRKALRSVSRCSMLRVFSEYRNFPKYSTLESLANSVGTQLPIIMIAALSSGPEAGFLVLASRVMTTPVTLIGNAVSQVYLSQAPDVYRAGSLGKFTANVLSGLVNTGVGPLIFAAIVAPVAFPIIFGDQWGRAGEIVAWMTPWVVAQLLVSPIAMTLDVTQNHRVGVWLQIIGIIIRVGSIVAADCWAPSWITECYAISGFIFYLLYLCVTILLASLDKNDIVKIFQSSFLVVIFWIFTAILTRIMLG